MGDRRCCCVVDCLLFEDDFNRSDNTNLGSNWEEVDEDSEIVSGELVVPASGMVVATAEADRGAMKVQATMVDLQPNKTYRIIVNYSATGYSYVEYECTNTVIGSDYVSYIRVGTSGGGDDDEIEESYTAGSDKVLTACRNEGGLFGTAESSENVAWNCEEEPNATRAGVANESATLDVEFDDFYIWNYEGRDSPAFPSEPDVVHRCYFCPCECDGLCVGDTLTLTISATGASSCLDGEEITLTYQPGNDPFQWYGSKTMKDPTCPLVGSTVKWWVTCNTDGSFTVYTDMGTVTQTGWSPSVYETASIQADAYSITCDPLQLIFGQFTETITPPCSPCDGEYYVIITE